MTKSQEKRQLRQQILNKRLALSLEECREKSDRLSENLQTLSMFKTANIILAYFSFKKEPDLSLLFNNYQKKWGFPRCVNKELIWHLWTPKDELKKGAYGINEPDHNLPLINPKKVDLMLVPAVACDYQGYRLGYGGGYYDRMLNLSQWQNIPTVGIIFDFAYLPAIPVEKWDKKLNYICTDLNLISINTH